MHASKPADASAPGTTMNDVQRLLDSETGARGQKGGAAVVLLVVPLLWSLFQLWIASPLPFALNFGVFNSTEARAIHLAFALFLAFSAFPMFKGRVSPRVPWYDWLLALAGAYSAAYLYIFQHELATRSGAPVLQDLVVAGVGVVLLLEATRRALGLPLTVVALVFLVYTFAGPYMPDVIDHKGASFSKVASHQWLTAEGVFGVALGVSTSFVFLFVLFGAMLEKAGAGGYFIRLAYALLGHMRGGPAKAAVVSSGLSGLISGSSIANVVTTGTFTIPLMKRVGFSPVKAGAVEVAASTNGQLTPPIMGAAAFLMVEYVGISYLEVIKHAILPAFISYVALFYIVHLEACKLGMQGLPRAHVPTLAQRLLSWGTLLIGLMILTLVIYYGVGWLKVWLGEYATWVLAGLLVLVYVVTLKATARYVPDDPHAEPELDVLPRPGPTLKSGLHYLLPVVLMLWCLTVERFSPELSAFWATVFLGGIMVTQRPLLALMRRSEGVASAWRTGLNEFFDALVSGARNMVGIGVATAAAGIVVGTVTLTGIGLVMTDLVELVSGGNVMLMLIFTALISLILGLGLPTTANYIVVSTLMAPVIVTLGAQSGLVVPLIAVHMFVFYFGILADDTPPVGLAAYAAAAISGGDPIRTGLQGFAYDIRTAILPFMFIFNTQLLLIGLTGWIDLVITVVSATIAMLAFAAATQGYWLTRTRAWEVAGLLLVAFTLFRPGFWWDYLYPPTVQLPASELVSAVESVDEGDHLTLIVEGEDINGRQVSRHVPLTVSGEGSGAQRLEVVGIEVREDEGRVMIDYVGFGSPAEAAGLQFDWEIRALELKESRPPKEWMFIPALLLLAMIGASQWRRAGRVVPPPAPT